MVRKAKNPFGVLSRRVGQSLENTPEVAAMRSRSKIVPNTWGGYATKALDMGLCEANRDEIVRFFGGEELVDLRSPVILFTEDYAEQVYRDYMISFKYGRRNYYESDLNIEVERLRRTFLIIVDSWRIDQAEADEESEALEAKINDGQDLSERDINLLCIRRDAVGSGICVDFQQFTETLLSCHILDDEYPSELAVGWISGIGDALSLVMQEYGFVDFRDIMPHEVYVSQDMIDAMIPAISWEARRLAGVYTDRDWDIVASVFEVPITHRTLEGTEI